MQKTLTVAWQQFKLLALHWSFLVTLLTPLLFVAFGGIYTAIVGWAGTLEQPDTSLPAPNVIIVNPVAEDKALGVVDEAGVIETIPTDLTPDRLIEFTTEADAQTAVSSEAIAGYYLVPADYLARGVVTYKSPTTVQFEVTDNAIRQLLIINLAQADGEAVGRRLAAAVVFDSVNQPLTGALPPDVPDPIQIIDIGVAVGISLFIMFTLGNACNLFLSQMARERQGRVLETVLGAMSARQLLAGKYLGLAAVGLLETLSWGIWVRVLGVAGEWLGGGNIAEQINTLGTRPAETPLPAINSASSATNWLTITSFDPALHTPTGLFLLCGLILIGGYLAYMAMAAVFGALTQDTRQASRINTLLSAIVTSPVPVWQILFAFGLLLGWAVLMLRLAARLFHSQTLLNDSAALSLNLVSRVFAHK
jgi:ABC-type Na+ efflux pump permease subunit